MHIKSEYFEKKLQSDKDQLNEKYTEKVDATQRFFLFFELHMNKKSQP